MELRFREHASPKLSLWHSSNSAIIRTTGKAVEAIRVVFYQICVAYVMNLVRQCHRLLPGRGKPKGGPERLPVVQLSQPLLPLPPAGRDPSRLTVVLDLDETLVCAYNTAGVPKELQNLEDPRLHTFEIRCDLPELGLAQNRKSGFGVQKVKVFERPGLHEFLQRASQFADLVLFTAGLEGYARPLTDVLDPDGGYFFARLYRPATSTTKYRDHVKDLSKLGRDMRRIVLLDNNPFSFSLQPDNGIPVLAFMGSPEDTQLLDVLLPLLEQLASRPDDVRPLLSTRYSMSSWFRARGVMVDS